jgi:demethylmenaquinone methyltransferase / 2-methoxy-6-polyprenyl-1,4-benzoquinol methylase
MALPSIEDKPQFVQHLFNRIAGRYDTLNNVISLGMHWGWKRQAVAALQLQQGQHALDVCTGTGDLLGILHKAVGDEGQVTGLDFSHEMLNVARKRYAQHPNTHLVQGDAMVLPFDEATFHGAVVAFGLRNVADVQTAIGELARCTKPGGWVVNLDTAPVAKLPGFSLYFKYIMPRFGQLLAGDKQAYQYLQASTEAFLTPEQLVDCFESAGLTQVSIQRVGFGSAAIIRGQKPA